MATKTPNINLNVTPTNDTSKNVINWRDEISSDNADSNMMIIDTEIGALKARKANLISGKIPAEELPSYVDDVLEFALYAQLPNPGEQGKIYVVYGDTTQLNGQYRWTGTVYVSISNQIDFATQQEAEAGEDNSKAMTALRTKQQIDSLKDKANGIVGTGSDSKVLAKYLPENLLTYVDEQIGEVIPVEADTLNGETAAQIKAASSPASHTHTASDLTTLVPVPGGGTGAADAAGARANLGACADRLADETAAVVWPDASTRPSSPTVNNALAKLTITDKIGDVKSTLRTDLGDKWLLCNGAGALKTEYPALGNLLSTQGAIVGIVPTMQMPVSTAFACDITTTPNIFAFVSNLTVYYTSLPFGTDIWHTSIITTNASMFIRCLKFLNGRWIAGGNLKETSSGAEDEVGYVFVNDTANLSGTWSTNRVDSGNYFSVTGVAFGNGLYSISATHYDSTSRRNYSWMYTSTNASSWTQRFSATPNNVVLTNVVYENSVYVALGFKQVETYVVSAVIVSSVNGTSWTYKDTGLPTRFYSAVYSKSTWIFGSDGRLYKAADLTVTPEVVHSELSYSAEGVILVSLDPDKVYVYGNATAAVYKISTDTFLGLQTLPKGNLSYNLGTQFLGDLILLKTSGSTDIYSTEYFSLPTVSISTLYTYIKALEE